MYIEFLYIVNIMKNMYFDFSINAETPAKKKNCSINRPAQYVLPPQNRGRMPLVPPPGSATASIGLHIHVY